MRLHFPLPGNCFHSASNLVIIFPLRCLRFFCNNDLRRFCLPSSGQHRPLHQRNNPEKFGGPVSCHLRSGSESHLLPDGEGFLQPLSKIRAVPRTHQVNTKRRRWQPDGMNYYEISGLFSLKRLAALHGYMYVYFTCTSSVMALKLL